ncbi:MAG: HD domain-containing protein, partial [Arenimonas sp.]
MTVSTSPDPLAAWIDRHAKSAALRPLLAAMGECSEPLPALAVQALAVLEELRADAEVQAAALLHLHPPLREAAATALADAAGVRQLLDGLQAAEQVWSLHARRDNRSGAEGLRRLLLALIRDLRVVLVLLATQLVSLRAAVTRPEPERRALAELTADIHAPLANRLG